MKTKTAVEITYLFLMREINFPLKGIKKSLMIVKLQNQSTILLEYVYMFVTIYQTLSYP